MRYDFIQRNISLERLETFRKIAQLGSIAEAADRDPNRQSQYSRQIKELENALETRLFDQRGRTRILNEDGRRLALLVETFFTAMDDFTASGRGHPRTLRLGAGESVYEGRLFPKLGELHSAFPKVQFQYRCLPTRTILSDLKTGRLDLGLVRGGQDEPDLRTFPVGTVQFNYVAARSLLSSKLDPTEQDLVSIPWACLAGEGRVKTAFLNFPRRLNAELHILAEAHSYQQLQHYVEEGIAAAVLPAWLAGRFPKDRFLTGTIQELKALNQSLELVAHPKTMVLRPFVESACERISRILYT